MTRSYESRIVGTVLLVLAGLGTHAGAATGVSTASGSTSTEPTPTPPGEGAVPVGRLMFSRFDEATHTFISTHVANADGGDETEISLPGPEGGGRWSRASTEIAVMTVLPDERIGTAVIAPDGTLLRVLEPPDDSLNLVCVVWSPDDSRLACEGWDESDPSRTGIYDVRSADGQDVVRLTTPPAGMTDSPGDYSPDGTQFVFKRASDEEPGPLMLVDVAGGEPQSLSTNVFEDPGRFSVDGATVLTSVGGSIEVVSVDGEVLHRVSGDGAFLFGPVWSPDGTWIAYSQSTTGPFADVFVSRPDGTDRRQVTDTAANEITIDWGPAPATDGEIDRVVDIGDGRGLYLRCTGTGTPTVIMEGGDEDTSSSYSFAEAEVAAVTRTCVYDRANLGRSDAAPGPRGLTELVGDLEALLDAAAVDGPYVMVGTSGGGYISVAFAVAHPDDIAGIVLVEVPTPFVDPPPEIVELTAWDHPANIEQRDYLQVEIDAWEARTEIGDIPVTVISNDYGPDAEPGERSNVADQQGWLVLSPRAEQVVVTTGHAVEEQGPQLVIDAILDVVEGASPTESDPPPASTTGTNGTGSPADVGTSGEATDVTIVGSWHRAQSCEEMLAVFDAAGLAESHLGWLQGNFFGGGPGPTEGDLCDGAEGPLEHDHFFTESGEFGSHDEHGEEVDGGDYEHVDADALVFPSHASEFGYDGDLTVDYEITDDVVSFDVVLPDECEDACQDAYAWALSAFASGPWTRVEVPS